MSHRAVAFGALAFEALAFEAVAFEAAQALEGAQTTPIRGQEWLIFGAARGKSARF